MKSCLLYTSITEVKKIAAMAEAYDVALAPHCPLGPVALAACIQVDATCYNAFIQEPVSYTHLDVYKRQVFRSGLLAYGECGTAGNSGYDGFRRPSRTQETGSGSGSSGG